MNYQLLTQALALSCEHPEITTIRCGIAASRLTSKLDLTEYSSDTLDSAERNIFDAIWRARPAQCATRIPGTWCQYCRAHADCASAASWATVAVWENRKVGAKTTSDLEYIEAIQRLSPERLVMIHVRSAVAKIIFEHVKLRLAEALPTEKLTELGYRLKPGANVRRVTDVGQAYKPHVRAAERQPRASGMHVAGHRQTRSLGRRKEEPEKG